ncbi:MAG: DegT/DnrJ/EryC1/StrS family aminotransferase, partial [Candidatus Altarchaeum sp.]|nr:DegT/DnrJ/EryC1/StrS family aminotransferase [Candidatus Altarchaeum sp.]
GVIAQGLKVEEFEKNFADYCNTKYAVAVNSGTAALYLALMAMRIKDGDEVITTPFSFIASANCILYVNAKPVFVDIDEKTFNISPDSIIEKITDKTKAIIPVHLYGQPCDMKAIMEITQDYNLKILGDACQAHGADFNNKKVGSFGDASAFSFYPTKNMTTSEGGMITTNDEEIAEKAKIFRNHGQIKRYEHKFLGYNLRMTDISAAIGIEQLKKLNKFNEKRIENAQYLSSKLKNINGIEFPYVQSNVKHVFHQYTVKIENGKRDEINKKLNEAGIGTGIYYPIPINDQPFYKKMGFNADETPLAKEMVKKVLSLPIHPSVTKENLDYIVEKLEKILK